MILEAVIIFQRSCSVQKGAVVTGKLATTAAKKQAKRSGVNLFGKRRKDESESFEEEEEEEEDVEGELSVYSYVTSFFSITSLK